MTVHLPDDLQPAIAAELEHGHFASVDALIAAIVRNHLNQGISHPHGEDLGSIGVMADCIELDDLIVNIHQYRAAETWREIDVPIE